MPSTKRLRTEPIVRVRTGCWACRRRKKKCDEAKPVCGGCVRNRLTCQWPSSVLGVPDSAAVTATTTPYTESHAHGLEHVSRAQHRTSSSPGTPSAASSSTSSDSAVSPEEIPRDMDLPMDERNTPTLATLASRASSADTVPPPIIASTTALTIGNALPRAMSMMPDHGLDAYQLLSHYMATTADCMANGSTPINPFLVQIVPLAFSSDLLLQLVLTQSAAHRAFRRLKDSDEVAQSHYTKALQLFRRGVTEFIEGKESNPLILTVGALVMCFTETAKGDMNGTIFDHLSAAHSLLLRLLAQSDAAVPKDLKDFVIEYYTYTAAVSMISIDARVSQQVLLNFDLEQKARQLLEVGYVGNLCGCWLELLLLIPCIFDLGRHWMVMPSNEDQLPAIVPTADEIAMYGSLQAQIMRWSPYPSVSPEVFLAGRIFQQAMLLYLYTSLGGYARSRTGMHHMLVQTAIAEAMSYLTQLSATARINSGLCWPIAVVGSCLSDVDQQENLRQRLTTMVSTFGLGNMHRTKLLLEHMWQMPLEEAGPWNICRAMEQNQIWISFA
ncbi:Zn(II)2Cys6 transcription factor [Aspergillus saccharolyticus JOP 1030-1]|uniref:Zn(2)-C6 fungal-type domain-containing protein n=1 Tax=Aspergillus saccharolyticus JOP 1030-1 TaxID=1450539 RepID=A0A318ZT77_9EURO|nr:hypothetical protein BP01DRAFT_292226 [Aspergillus saccharolyticus JOP 1030-1]PYH47170.1 hypothetical protein BP01DRAFT_292226 [Aspergillus saccharolyticus JOP 1030-1]